MNWELIGGVAAGLADAKRRADQDEDTREYRKAARDLWREQSEDIRARRAASRSSQMATRAPGSDDPVIDPGRDDPVRKQMRMMGVDGVEGRARGGLVGNTGGADGLVDYRDWYESRGYSTDIWQKQSFKK